MITRPEPSATQTAAAVSALGFSPIVAPIFSIVGRNLKAPDHVAATLLTSRNSVTACPDHLHDRPVFAVGTATAGRAREAGFKRVWNADGDAQALATLVAGMVSPADGSLFLPAGQGQALELAASLRQHGFHIVRRIAYQAVGVAVLPDAITSQLRTGELSTAMFFSPDASRHFVRLLQAAGLIGSLRDVEAVSISERTAMPLRSLDWRRIIVAEKPNQDAMLALLT